VTLEIGLVRWSCWRLSTFLVTCIDFIIFLDLSRVPELGYLGMDTAQYVIVGLGELLWDIFPNGKQLGGAPANFAYYASVLGNEGIIASRLGRDSLAQEAIECVQQLGLSSEFIQLDSDLPTGTVAVTVDAAGQPEFSIRENVAWDYLDWSESWRALAINADAVCFGSLAQRAQSSRNTIRRFIEATRRDALVVFDANLRQGFYSSQLLAESLHLSRIAKLNEQELYHFDKLLNLKGSSVEKSARILLKSYDLELVCVTRGGDGSLLVTASQTHEHRGLPVAVVDTVGAGDAFTAVLTDFYLRGRSLDTIGDAANRMGAWVATQKGAMKAVDPSILLELTKG
jgi:fructokinase